MVGVGKSETKMLTKTLKCVVCGKKAAGENNFKLPGCETHLVLPTKNPTCPECDRRMIVKTGKERAFWSCPIFPECFGTRNLLTPDEEKDIL